MDMSDCWGGVPKEGGSCTGTGRGYVYEDCGERGAPGCVQKGSVGKSHFETSPGTEAARGWRSTATSHSGI